MKRPDFLKGVIHTSGVSFAYVFVYLAFGAVCHEKGLTFLESFCTTAFVRALPLQLFLIQFENLTDIWPVIALAFLINFRLFLLSGTLFKYLKDVPLYKLVPSFFLLATSPFTVAFLEFKQNPTVNRFHYYLAVALTSYLTALIVTAIGYVSVDIAHSAFVASFIPIVLPIHFSALVAKHFADKKFVLASLLGFLAMPIVLEVIPKYGLVIVPLLVATICFCLQNYPKKGNGPLSV